MKCHERLLVSLLLSLVSGYWSTWTITSLSTTPMKTHSSSISRATQMPTRSRSLRSECSLAKPEGQLESHWLRKQETLTLPVTAGQPLSRRMLLICPTNILGDGPLAVALKRQRVKNTGSNFYMRIYNTLPDIVTTMKASNVFCSESRVISSHTVCVVTAERGSARDGEANRRVLMNWSLSFHCCTYILYCIGLSYVLQPNDGTQIQHPFIHICIVKEEKIEL